MGLFGFRSKKKQTASAMRDAPGGTARDPVCGMSVEPATAKGGSATHAGTTYHFCSTGCHDRFERDPHQFLGAHAH